MNNFKYEKNFNYTHLFVFCELHKKRMVQEKTVEECIREGQASNSGDKLFSEKQIYQICECAVDKMMSKYKSYEEAQKDTKGSREIGRDCYDQIMGE